MNIMDMVKKAVTDKAMGQIGGMLGMSDPKKTESTFDTAIGSILGGMMKKSTSQDGAKQVFDMSSNADPGIMDKLGDLLGGGDEQLEAVQKSGGGMLEGLFGGNQNSMIQSVAKALGLDGSLVGKLLMLAAPMLLGSIGKHIKSAGMDALGLSSLLGEQKDHVAAALPSGLTQDLGFGNLLSNTAGSPAPATTKPVSRAPAPAKETAPREAAPKGGGLLPILLPLIILGAIAWFSYPYIMKAINKGEEKAKDVTVNNPVDFGSMDVSAMGETGAELQQGFSEITTGFTGLADKGIDGAGDLATKIGDFSGSIGDMDLGNLPEKAKPVATTMIGKFIETIEDMLAKQSDAIKGILQGPVNTLIEKLKPFAKTI